MYRNMEVFYKKFVYISTGEADIHRLKLELLQTNKAYVFSFGKIYHAFMFHSPVRCPLGHLPEARSIMNCILLLKTEWRQ